MPICTVIIAAVTPLAAAQDAARGARLYADTARLTGRPVAACAACHAEVRTLRELIANRGGPLEDAPALARWFEAVLAGAQPGAANAKAQYRGALKSADIRDLAAYIVEARRAAAATSAVAAVGAPTER
jgi:cytochrome c553